MGAPTKRARKVRSAAEFDTSRLAAQLKTPRATTGIALTSWTLAQIFAARDAQLRGQFYLPARMAESMRTDDALAVAFENRLAPQRCIKTSLVAAGGSRGLSIAGEAEALFGNRGVGINADTRASIHACLTNHDVAFASCTQVPRADGSRVDTTVSAWPIEHVRWDPLYCCYMTRVDPDTATPADLTIDGNPVTVGSEVPIIHGDGRWVIFQRFETEPYKHAAILSAALVWARHAYGIRDWAKGSVAHGSAKVVGALPEGVTLQSATGALTEEATALLEALQSIATSDSPVVIKPSGAIIDFLTNNSAAWQVWKELVANAEAAAARVYLGTDGTLGSKGGSPGVDITALFGVALTKVEGDLSCISRGIQTGVIEPWCAMNFGDSTLAPQHRYLFPDADADAERASEERRRTAFFADIKSSKDNGFVVDQTYVDTLADVYDIDAPKLPQETDAKVPTIALAPTDLARVVSVNEARASAGLGALALRDGTEDPDGFLTVEQFAEKKKAAVAPPVAPPALRSIPGGTAP